MTTMENIADAKDQSSSSESGQVRANPITIKWLIDNFESLEGMSLPRSLIFGFYERHCRENRIETMNPATFGKTIRSVFPNLKSRRLGTRGHSKYHYYGLGIKGSSPLIQSVPSSDGGSEPLTPRARVHVRTRAVAKSPIPREPPSTSNEDAPPSQAPPAFVPSVPQDEQMSDVSRVTPEKDYRNVRSRACLPDLLLTDLAWMHLENQICSISIGMDSSYSIVPMDLRRFRELYRRHCEVVYEAVSNLKFANVEHQWAVFWRSRHDDEMESVLPTHKLQLIANNFHVQEMIINIEIDFFSILTSTLIPDVLRPLPGSLTQLIRNFAKSMEGWTRESMGKMPRRLTHNKLLVASAIAQTLRRLTSLNHLAQAARTVLTNQAQTETMLNDISRLDMFAIYDQGSLMCPADTAAMKRFSDEFKTLLSDQEVSEKWPVWIERILDLVVGHCDKQSLVAKSQKFCQQWSFFSSLVIRDLTLRSAASFGSFHLIRLLFDEYVVYAIEQRTAQRYGTSPLRQFYEHLLNLYPESQSYSPGRPTMLTYAPQVSPPPVSRSESECSGEVSFAVANQTR